MIRSGEIKVHFVVFEPMAVCKEVETAKRKFILKFVFWSGRVINEWVIGDMWDKNVLYCFSGWDLTEYDDIFTRIWVWVRIERKTEGGGLWENKSGWDLA